MKDRIVELLKDVLSGMGITDVSPLVTRSEDPAHGEYATNVAMVIAKRMKKNPMEIAKEIQEGIIKYQKQSTLAFFEKVEIAPPGFINFFLSEAKLINQVGQVLTEGDRYGISTFLIAAKAKSPFRSSGQSKKKSPKSASGESDSRMYAASGESAEKKIGRQNHPKKVMIEFADANPFKEFHIGHLRNIALGESFSRLLEAAGHDVRRVSYQGDVGMHVAKALYGMQQNANWSNLSDHVRDLSNLKTSKEKAEFLGKAYAAGAKAYEEDEEAKKEITEINKKVYRKDASILPFWEEGRQISLEYFDTIYDRLGTDFTRFYFESEVAPIGAAIVADHVKDGVFEESEGAVIFRGEKVGLHTRVFVSKEGYATYEAKDLALAPLKYSEYPYDLSIIMTGNEQSAYFAVMLAALDMIHPDLAEKTKHIPFGMVRLTQGKMSSRTGNVITADWLIEEAKSKIRDIIKESRTNYKEKDKDTIAEKAAIAAVKYSMLKVTASSDIAFDLEKSVSFEGDSGPYLQYTYARCRSVLRKAGDLGDLEKLNEKEEKALTRLMGYFPEIVVEAAEHFSANIMCTYLFDLAQAFNLLYAKHEILGNASRLRLTAATAQIIKNGLYLLGIEVLEQM